MYGGGQGFEAAVVHQLADVAFIDGEDDKLAAAREQLVENRWFGERGVWGVLASTNRGDCTEAIASIYARIAAQLGFFELARRLDADQ